MQIMGNFTSQYPGYHNRKTVRRRRARGEATDDKILFKKMSLRLNMCSVRIEPRDAHLDEKTIRKQK